MRGFAGIAAIIGLSGFLAATAVAQTTGRNPSHADILRGFDIAALYADKSQGTTGYGSGATMTGIVAKWTRPVVYRVDGMTYDKARIAETMRSRGAEHARAVEQNVELVRFGVERDIAHPRCLAGIDALPSRRRTRAAKISGGVEQTGVRSEVNGAARQVGGNAAGRGIGKAG